MHTNVSEFLLIEEYFQSILSGGGTIAAGFDLRRVISSVILVILQPAAGLQKSSPTICVQIATRVGQTRVTSVSISPISMITQIH